MNWTGKNMDALVERIRLEISEAGVCNLGETCLASIWGNDDTLSLHEKRERVKAFSQQHGFASVVDFGLSCAVFQNSR